MVLIGLAKKLKSKMENISKKSNLSLLIFCFNNTVTSAATLHMGKSMPSNEDSTYAS